MPQSSGGSLLTSCSRRYHNWTKPPCSVSWEGSSKRKLCTNEVCHPKRPIALSTHSFRMQPRNLCSKAHGNTTISVLPKCSNLSFLRLLRHSRNFWHITTLKQGSQSKQSIIGITLGK